MRILCTNDDGYLAPGLHVLTHAARELGEVEIVAPDREQSATSNSLTIHRPLRAREALDGAHVVDGTPTDCVIVALRGILESPPDMCFSGINHGANMGEDVLYSGTVAAATEATILGIPAVALSYVGEDYENLPAWQGVVTDLLRKLVDRRPFPEHTLMNINLPPIPPAEVKGVRVTSLGKRRYSDSLTRTTDPRGREYFWIGGTISQWTGSAESDFKAIEEGYISLTPLHLDLTNYTLLEEIRGWSLDL
jgi:5'-nucleotidase